ncbi:MAG: hypothetical protein R6U91_06215 [Bacillota bacterium]
MANNQKNKSRIRWILFISIWTFILAVLLGLVSHYFLDKIESITSSFIILLFVASLGIIFDLIGTAAAAANIAPLNAKASRKVSGAKLGVNIVKNAERVATFCNDVAGDISGIISGTLVTTIVLKMVIMIPYGQAEFFVGVLLTALIAAITVGGKALGKIVAINYSTEVILLVGFIVTKLQKPLALFSKSGEKLE